MFVLYGEMRFCMNGLCIFHIGPLLKMFVFNVGVLASSMIGFLGECFVQIIHNVFSVIVSDFAWEAQAFVLLKLLPLLA